jgi:poly-beta-1,6-N-acetyl-D-glucosamine synthase
MSELAQYVLITPARNEAQFIELTLTSVIAQTARPLKWLIVSDGSTDATDDIVRRYAAEHSWIELVRMPERRERHFAGKAHAFNAGYARVRDLPFDVIGSLDGDLSFDGGYFKFLLQKLSEDPSLGLVGTPFQERSGEMYDYRFSSLENVSGACQLFRRQCFEQIGGYVPLKEGGIDHVAQIATRMKGWKTRTFTEKVSHHHRKMGTGRHGHWMVWFRHGIKDYMFGNHPVWEIARTIYQMTKKPLVLGGLLLAAGYWWGLLRRYKTPLSHEMRAFIRHEQIGRLKAFLSNPAARLRTTLPNPSLDRS